MSEENKKQVRKVAVGIVADGVVVDELVYKVVVTSDSAVEAEIETRLGELKDESNLSWKILQNELVKEV